MIEVWDLLWQRPLKTRYVEIQLTFRATIGWTIPAIFSTHGAIKFFPFGHLIEE